MSTTPKKTVKKKAVKKMAAKKTTASKTPVKKKVAKKAPAKKAVAKKATPKVKKVTAKKPEQSIIITPTTAHSIVPVGSMIHEQDKSVLGWWLENSKSSHIDTGLIPLNGTGLLSYRNALDSTQIVYQHSPGEYLIYWGEYEGERDAPLYRLAQPWRVWIADLYKENLLGIRHFYSHEPFTSLDQQLYHVNLPNLNCYGYGAGYPDNVGVGVGWICLYHKHNWIGQTIGQKIQHLIELAGGSEAYNTENMAETDGVRLYEEHRKPVYTYNAEKWQEKTKKEGFAWTLDPDLWIPVKVEGIDSQDRHVNDGIPLTLGMAMHGRYKAYYTDPTYQKPFNAIARDDENDLTPAQIEESVRSAFGKAK